MKLSEYFCSTTSRHSYGWMHNLVDSQKGLSHVKKGMIDILWQRWRDQLPVCTLKKPIFLRNMGASWNILEARETFWNRTTCLLHQLCIRKSCCRRQRKKNVSPGGGLGVVKVNRCHDCFQENRRNWYPPGKQLISHWRWFSFSASSLEGISCEWANFMGTIQSDPILGGFLDQGISLTKKPKHFRSRNYRKIWS